MLLPIVANALFAAFLAAPTSTPQASLPGHSQTPAPLIAEAAVLTPRSVEILTLAAASDDPVEWTVGVRHARILKTRERMAAGAPAQPGSAPPGDRDVSAQARALVQRIIASGDATALVRLWRICAPGADYCDRAAILARLQGVDAGNGAPAAGALHQAITDKDNAGVSKALDAMAAATHVRYDINRVLAAEMRLAARARDAFPTTPRPNTDPQTEQKTWWLRLHEALLVAYQLELDTVAKACVPGASGSLLNSNGPDRERVVKSCRHFWRFATQDSFPPGLAHIPYYAVMLIPETPEELLAMRARTRNFLWLYEQCMPQLYGTVSGERWTMFYSRSLSGDLLGACRSLIATAGIAEEPDRAWKPKSLTMRDVPEDWLRSVEAGGATH